MTHPPDVPAGRPAQPSFGGLFSRSFLIALLCGVLAVVLWRDLRRGPLLDPHAEPRAVAARGDLAQDEASTVRLFEVASPSVVHINTARRQLVRDFFRAREVEVPEGSGSGFVWDEQGHIVTNDHVVATASDVEVRLNDQSVYRATVVGEMPEYDLAVLHVDAPPGRLPPIAIGTSADLRVGQKAFAIGNPFGLDQTLTTGIISGLDRQMVSIARTTIDGVIQTDAAINPGNSGGPLLDSAGRLIGINTAIQSPSGAAAGVGFAVPVDTINRIVPLLIRGGRPRAGLGIQLGSDQLVRRLRREGALVWATAEGGAAERAGLLGMRREGDATLFGDLIVALDGERVRHGEDLLALLQEHQPGDEVALTILRDPAGRAREQEVRVRLQELAPR